MLFSRMKSAGHTGRVAAMLAILLVGALAAIAILYPRATRPLVAEHQHALVAAAQRDAATFFGANADEIRRRSFPIVISLSDRTCVELKPLHGGNGGYVACYDAKSGHLVEELGRSAAFGS